jgi:hypothetical protein
MKTVSYYVEPKLVQTALKSKIQENKISNEATLLPKAKVKKATYFKNTFQRYSCYKPGYRAHRK